MEEETKPAEAAAEADASDKPPKKRFSGLRPHITPAGIAGFCIFSAYLLLGTLLIVATFTDREVAEYLFTGETGFTALFDVIGKLPGYFMLFAGAVLLFRCAQRQKCAKVIVLDVLYALLAFAAAALLFLAAFERIERKTLRYALSLLLAAALTAVALLLVRKLPRQQAKRLEKWAALAVLTIGAVIVLTGLLKIIWGRVRYLNDPDFSQFTPWYKPAHSKDGDSFPSGHTALMAGMLLLPVFVRQLTRKKLPVILAAIAAACFIAVTPVARLMGGYHYLSDVTTSLLITLSVFTVLFLALFSRGRTSFSGKNGLERLLLLGPDPVLHGGDIGDIEKTEPLE